jgi:hypothetical protein
MSSNWSEIPSEILNIIGQKFSICTMKDARLVLKSWTEPFTRGSARIEGAVPTGVVPTFHNITSLYWKTPPSDKAEFDKVPLNTMKHIHIKYDINFSFPDPLLDYKRKVLDNLFSSDVHALESLDMIHSGIVPTGISNWPSSSRITTLKLEFCKIKDTFVPELLKLENLTFLDLSYNDITDNGIECMTSMKRLATLNLAGCSVTDICLPFLPKTITSLDVSCCHSMTFQSEFVFDMPHVTTLKLRNVGIRNTVLSTFPASITFLDLSDICQVELELDGNLSHMTSLQTLLLKDTRGIKDACLETLPPSITHLNLKRYEGVNLNVNLSRMTSLQTLILDSNCNITDASFDNLPSSITNLEVRECRNVRLCRNINLPNLKTLANTCRNQNVTKHSKCFRFFDFFTVNSSKYT